MKLSYKNRVHPALGKKHTEESKRKMSESKKGRKSPLLGRKLSEETKRKIGSSNSGSRSSLWRGGLLENYSDKEKIRKSLEYRLWRKAIFERDNYTCQKTGIRGCELVAHHINNFAHFPELRTSIENGITLSKKAHKDFHRKYGNIKNTKEQLDKFLSVH